MGFKSDIEISQEAALRDIREIAAKLGLTEQDLDVYGRYKAKVARKTDRVFSPQAKLILVTAISPTPMGEGKTTATSWISIRAASSGGAPST